MLPQYSGGLGILAGDHLKAASDLGVPIVGVGPALPPRLLQAVAVPRGLAAGALPGPRPRRAAALAAARGRRRARDRRGRLPGGPDLRGPDLGRQVGRVPLLLLDSDVEEQPRPLPRRHRPALRRQQRAPAAPGDAARHRRRPRAARLLAGSPARPQPEVFHTNEGHAGFLGLERIRELTVDEGGPGLDFDAALEVSRAATVFTTHTPGAGRHRPVPARAGRAVLRRRPARRPASRSSGSSPSAPRTTRAATPSVFNMAVMGFRLAQRANGVSQLHGHVSREMFSGLWPAFDEAEVPIGSITNGVHAPTWVAREVIELAEPQRRRPRLRRRRGVLRAPSTASPAPTSGRSSASSASASSSTPAGGWRSPGAQRGAAEAELGWVDERPRPRRADDRLRAPRAVVQAADADAARPGAAQGAAAAPRAAGPDGHRRQGAPGRRRRQEADPGDRPVRRRPRGAAPHRLPAQLRHRDGPAALPRLRRVAQQPAAPLRGVRHLRHEGRAQRRPQPVDPRRLVGRVVRRQQRLGDPVRRRRRRPRPARRPRGQRRSTT